MAPAVLVVLLSVLMMPVPVISTVPALRVMSAVLALMVRPRPWVSISEATVMLLPVTLMVPV